MGAVKEDVKDAQLRIKSMRMGAEMKAQMKLSRRWKGWMEENKNNRRLKNAVKMRVEITRRPMR